MIPNRLINEKSPYLLQHAHNPVQWYPWGDEAFNKAKNENKPVFLSIGYSTCHWCHVMEKESFEDNEAAEILNTSFVPVKVDREERPDIDGIYMTVCQLLTGSGGWPLTILMTPDKKPFFAGTYFPKENRFGRSGLIDILKRIDHIWKTRKDDIIKSADEITGALQNTSRQDFSIDFSIDLLDKTYTDLSKRHDSLHGGFGNAPKFPTPHNLLFLLRYWKRTGDANALDIVEKTLSEMRKGGIYDHIGFGFHRYSTDRKWLAPHFEKMLYDQALIAAVYIEAYQATRNDFYKETAEEIFTYVLRDMTSSEGTFYSAEDADSEGVEGKFYLWSEDEIRNLLKEDADLFIKTFNITGEGNWIDPMHDSANGKNIIHLEENYGSLASEFNLTEAELKQKSAAQLNKLFIEREKRIHPYKDDKILTDWNSLMISALAKGYAVFGNEKYLSAAEKCALFIIDKMKSGSKLLHRYREGEAGLTAHLDDYAFFTSALIDLYEASFNSKYLMKALDLMELALEEFWDNASGGFYFTAADNKDLISRQKDLYDGAIPSGNSVSILNLLRLSRMTNNAGYEQKAMKSASVFASNLKSSPAGYTCAAAALEFAFAGSYEIIIAGIKDDKDVKRAVESLNREYIPNKVVLFASEEDELLLEISPFLKDYKREKGKTTLYVCKNYQCSLPVHTAEEMIKLLK